MSKNENPLSLEALLTDVYHKIKSYFPDAQLSLQFVADPDIIDAQDRDGDLVVSIITRVSAVEAVQKLEQFYQGWWLYTASEAEDKGKICFNLECV